MGAFAERVTQQFELSPSEIAFLERLEAKPVPVKRGQLIIEEGQPAEHAFVLITGWAMSCSRFPDGTQQVRRLHFSGDLLSMPSIPMRHHPEDVEALSDGVISPFRKSLLADLFAMPRLTAIMYMFAQAERITAGDRLANLGRNCAKARVAFLLMDILQRLRSADCTISNTFYMHLTREQVAQFTGMTSVHASRMWSSLVSDGLIACDHRVITILDEPALARISRYRNSDDFDFRWLKLVDDHVDPMTFRYAASDRAESKLTRF